MKIFHNTRHAEHSGRQEMFRGRLVDCHEVPQRLQHVLDELARRPVGTLVQPATDLPLDAALQRVHSADYLDFLAHAWRDWVALDPANAAVDALPSVWPLAARHGFRTDVPPLNFAARLGQYAFDSGTPLMAGSWAAAREGAACALAAAQAVLGGERFAMALTRPPGHHAGPNYMGGYCFINNAAVAAQALRDGGLQRVAVLDVDYHHGNGTQTIFYERSDVFTASIHGDLRWLDVPLELDCLDVHFYADADPRSGAVTIRYRTLDQLDLICQRLTGGGAGGASAAACQMRNSGGS